MPCFCTLAFSHKPLYVVPLADLAWFGLAAGTCLIVRQHVCFGCGLPGMPVSPGSRWRVASGQWRGLRQDPSWPSGGRPSRLFKTILVSLPLHAASCTLYSSPSSLLRAGGGVILWWGVEEHPAVSCFTCGHGVAGVVLYGLMAWQACESITRHSPGGCLMWWGIMSLSEQGEWAPVSPSVASY